MHKNGVGVD